jgi:hypothetical protein
MLAACEMPFFRATSALRKREKRKDENQFEKELPKDNVDAAVNNKGIREAGPTAIRESL